ncbi:MAG TPA: HD domain-containing protein, partial [Candidatus Yonathbacteria bacterium]|nr:HD domain-containing protein [Candidatus Yonathbacteria bacterium]
MLQYTLRVRDLVHGTILFTALEQKIINHPLFQRLRQIRQNDVAFYVYPSLNTSRFEHVLGTCRVAGMMAENLTKSPKWRTYARELKAQTGVASKEEFVELARLYALLHDIGHLPLSHLFEMAVGSSQEVAKEWTNVQGFSKLHEAFGAVIVRRLIEDIVFPEDIKRALLCLMTEKSFSLENPLSVVKALIDAEIDADRIDFVRRDGLLAGGEYGNYDIRRLCDCVFIERDERGWLVAYSESAITSMEALLLDRYRTHVWIHFHHQVVAMKMLVRHLINKACEAGAISKKHFSIARIEEFAMRDDVWLWNVLRGMEACDELTHMIQRAVFFREKSNVVNLWKNRPAYHELREKVMRKARTTDLYFGM